MPSASAPAASHYTTWQNNTHKTWYKDKGLTKSMITIFSLYFCVFTVGYDGSLLNGLQTLGQWQAYFNNPSGSELGLISICMYFPLLVFPFVAAWMSEKYGRRMPIFVGAIVLMAGAFIVTFANGKGMFMGGRVVIGVGSALQSVAAAPMIMELAHPRLRSVAGASFLCVYYVGSTCSSWICYATQSSMAADNNWAWRIPSLFCALGAFVNFIYIACGLMEESPRWLIQNGQQERGYQVLAKLWANGQMDDELVQKSIQEIEAGFAMDAAAKHTGYTAFFKTKGNRWRLAVIIALATGTQLNGVGLVSYYLAPILTLVGITERGQQAGLNGGLAIFNLVCAVAAAQVVDRWGRRPLWLFANIGQLVCFICVMALSGAFASSGAKAIGTAVVPFLFLYYGFYDSAWTVLPNLYIPEITPYHLRAKAMGIYGFIQAVSLVFNQYVNPVALEAIGWKYYGVYVAVIAGYLIFAYFYLIETKGYTIEEVSRLFDGHEAVEDVEAAGERNHLPASLDGSKAEDVHIDNIDKH